MPNVQVKDLLKTVQELQTNNKKDEETTRLLRSIDEHIISFLGSAKSDAKSDGGGGKRGILKNVQFDPQNQQNIIHEPAHTEPEEEDSDEEDDIPKPKQQRDDMTNPYWLDQPEFDFGDSIKMNEDEAEFWRIFIDK